MDPEILEDDEDELGLDADEEEREQRQLERESSLMDEPAPERNDEPVESDTATYGSGNGVWSSEPSKSFDEWVAETEGSGTGTGWETEATGSGRISVDAYRKEVSGLLEDETFWEKPYEEQVMDLRRMYLGEDMKGTREFEDDDAIVGIHKELLSTVREYSGAPMVTPEDYQDLIAPWPTEELKNAKSSKDVAAALDKWEATSLSAGKANGGIYWRENQELIENQIAETVDWVKRTSTAEKNFPSEKGLAAQIFGNFSTATKAFLTTGAGLLPDSMGGKKIKRAIETTSLLPESEATLKGEVVINAPLVGEIEMSSVASGIGSGATFIGAGLAANALKIPKVLAAGGIMSAGARLGYAEAYETVFEKTGSVDQATKAGFANMPIEALDRLFDAAVGMGLISPLKKGVSVAAKKTALSRLAASGFLGEGTKNGFRILGNTAIGAVGEGVVEVGQEFATGQIEAHFANDPTLKRTGGQLGAAFIGGVVAGGGGSVMSEVNIGKAPAQVEEAAAEDVPEQSPEERAKETAEIEEGLAEKDTVKPEELVAPPADEMVLPKEETTSPSGETIPGASETEQGQAAASTGNLEDVVPETGKYRSLDGREFVAERRFVPIEDIVVQKDIKQFKKGADPETGVTGDLANMGDSYVKVGSPDIVLLQKDVTGNGEIEVVTGRNRFAKAKEDPNVNEISAYVYKESEGFTLSDAKIMDVEDNIRSNQGETIDYAKFFEMTKVSRETARARGYLRNLKGLRGFNIGTHGSEEIRTAYYNEKIDEKQAAAIAVAAPGNAELQRTGLADVLDGIPVETAVNTMRVVERAQGLAATGQQSGGTTIDWLGNSQVMADARVLGQMATTIQKELRDALTRLQDARRLSKKDLKNLPGIRANLAVEDPKAVKAEAQRLTTEITRWDTWSVHPDLVAQVEERAAAEMKEKGAQLGLSLKERPAASSQGQSAKNRTEGQPEREEAQAEEPEEVDDRQGDMFGTPRTPTRSREELTLEANRLGKKIQQLKSKLGLGREQGFFVSTEVTPEEAELYPSLGMLQEQRQEVLRERESASRNSEPETPDATEPAIRAPSNKVLPVRTERWGQDPPRAPAGVANPIPSTPPAKKGQPVSPTEVIDLAAKVTALTGAKVPIREASMTGRQAKRALGHYETIPEVIRTKVANDIPTAVHEVAHAIDFNLWGWTNPFVKGWPKKILNELTQMGHDLYGSTTPAAGYRREGWAEFLKFWTLGKDAYLQKKAPEFTKWFETEFAKKYPDIMEALRSTREKAIEYYGQSTENRIQGHIVQSKNLWERLRGLVSAEGRNLALRKAKKELIDFGAPFEYLENAALESLDRQAKKPGVDEVFQRKGIQHLLGKTKLPLSFSPYRLYDSLRMTVDSRVAYMVQHGMIDIAGNKIDGAPSLQEVGNIVQKSEAKPEQFFAYLYAKRALALWSDPIKGPRNPGIPKDIAGAYVTEIEAKYPELALAASKLYSWHDGILNYMAQASPEFERIVEKIREIDPGYYIPLQREFKKIDELASRVGKDLNNAAVFKRLFGSGRRILNPIDSSINNARAMLASAHKRMVLDAVLRVADIPGMGHLVTEIPREQVPVASKSLADLLRTVEKQLQNKPGFEGARVAIFEEESGAELDQSDLAFDFATIFAPAMKAPEGETAVMTATVNGRPKFFEIDGELLEALEGMDPYSLSKAVGFWHSFLGPIEHTLAKTARLGLTAYNVPFQLYSNLARDFQTYFVQSAQEGGIAQVVRMYGKMLMTGAMENFVRDPKARNAYFDLSKRLGVESSNFLGGDFRAVERARGQVFGGRRVVDVPSNFVGLFAEVLSTPEKATRTAELAGRMRDLGINPAQELTLEQAVDLMLPYKQVTTDFTAAGRTARAINAVLPFFNASIQGPRALIRAAHKNPARVGAIMLSMSALSAMNWWRNKDEEWWEELTDESRYLFTWVPFTHPITGAKELWKVPRPYEIAGLTMALTESMLDSMYKSDPEMVKGWLNAFVKATGPVSFNPTSPLDEELILNMPIGTRTLVQEWLNRDVFWNRNIVPRSMERAPAEMQFNEYTSTAAKTIGGILNVSPMKVDFAIRGLFGTAPQQMMEWADTVTNAEKANPTRFHPFTGSDIVDGIMSPFINRALAREGQAPTGGRSVNHFYDTTLREAEYEWQTTGDKKIEKLYRMVQDAQKSLAALRDLRRVAATREDRNKLNDKIRDIAQRVNTAWKNKDSKEFTALRNERRQVTKKVKPIREREKAEKRAQG